MVINFLVLFFNFKNMFYFFLFYIIIEEFEEEVL